MHATLFHQFFNVSIAQRVGHILTNARQDHINRKAHSFDIQHLASLLILKTVQHTRSRHGGLNATKPLGNPSVAACPGLA